MAEFYLVSQLPSLEGLSDNSPLPITEERFLELCTRFLSKKSIKILEQLTINPSRDFKKTGSALVDAWFESERDLRLALGKVRAEKLKKHFDTTDAVLPIEHVKAAGVAVDIENPLEAEQFLNGYRLRILDSLMPMDNFSEDFVFYYGLKLKLIARIRQFDADAGKAMYKEIYDSILSGDRLEVKR